MLRLITDVCIPIENETHPCPMCGNLVKTSYNFCPTCGQELTQGSCSDAEGWGCIGRMRRTAQDWNQIRKREAERKAYEEQLERWRNSGRFFEI